jgi:glyoxylase-like metal-dependent hydrolase (beta-lactamase superfamily II)
MRSDRTEATTVARWGRLRLDAHSGTRCVPPLFPGGHGKTATPEDHLQLMDDLEERIFGPLPDETWFYPGHGDDSTLGAERPHLGEWRERGW